MLLIIYCVICLPTCWHSVLRAFLMVYWKYSNINAFKQLQFFLYFLSFLVVVLNLEVRNPQWAQVAQSKIFFWLLSNFCFFSPCEILDSLTSKNPSEKEKSLFTSRLGTTAFKEGKKTSTVSLTLQLHQHPYLPVAHASDRRRPQQQKSELYSLLWAGQTVQKQTATMHPRKTFTGLLFHFSSMSWFQRHQQMKSRGGWGARGTSWYSST